MADAGDHLCQFLVKSWLMNKGLDKAVKEVEKLEQREGVMDVATDNDGGAYSSLSSSSSSSSTLPAVLSLPSAVPRDISESYMKRFLAEDLIVFGINSGDLSLYTTGYDALRSWAISSLEMVKAELLGVCFPVFVHWWVTTKFTLGTPSGQWFLWFCGSPIVLRSPA